MTNPEFKTASSQVEWLLNWASELVRTRSWGEADTVFQRAIKVDASPAGCIAYACALAEQERFNEALCQSRGVFENSRGAIDRRRGRDQLNEVHLVASDQRRELSRFIARQIGNDQTGETSLARLHHERFGSRPKDDRVRDHRDERTTH